MHLRPIRPTDNAAIAHVIRTVMPEFGCVGEGYSINDPEIDDMAAAYAGPGAAFFVVETEGAYAGAGEGAPGSRVSAGEGAPGSRVSAGESRVVGGAGFAPLAGGDASTCELRKMYLLPAGRGHGAGQRLLRACLDGAAAAGYERMYLETVTAMAGAAALYRKHGFTYLEGPLGATGHSSCDRFMIRDL